MVFDDFIAAGEYLVSQKYSSKDYLAISESNGGLIVGAWKHSEPDLYKVCFQDWRDGYVAISQVHCRLGMAVEYGSSDSDKFFRTSTIFSSII